MAVSDENIAVRCDDNVGRTVKLVLTVAGDAGLAERHQKAAVGTEFQNVLAIVRFPVGDPYAAVRCRAQAGGQLIRPEPKLTINGPLASNF